MTRSRCKTCTSCKSLYLEYIINYCNILTIWWHHSHTKSAFYVFVIIRKFSVSLFLLLQLLLTTFQNYLKFDISVRKIENHQLTKMVFQMVSIHVSRDKAVLLLTFTAYFFSISVFFHEYSRLTGQQGKGEGIYLTPLYHFHSLHRHLGISWAITAESSPVYVASSRTRTGNL